MLRINYPITLERNVTLRYDDGSQPSQHELVRAAITYGDANFSHVVSGWDANGRLLLDLCGFRHGELLRYCRHCGHEKPLRDFADRRPGYFRR